MTTFIFEIDIERGTHEISECSAEYALSRRISMGMDVNETIKIVSVRKKGK